MSPWKDFEPRSGGRRGAAVPFISTRPDGIAFNKAFVQSAQMEKYRYVSIRTNAQTHELEIRLHNEPTRNSLTLIEDGAGRVAQTTALYHEDGNEWLKRVTALKDARARRFLPRLSGNTWVITIQPEPAFEMVATRADEIAPGVCGVYRCFRGDGERPVKIGEGVLRDRFNAHRARFEFDRMEYSIVEDDAERVKWQNVLLDNYRAKYGGYPEQNPIRA